MIFKVDKENKLHQIPIPPEEEEVFLQIQSQGKIKYVKIDENQLPQLNLKETHIKPHYKYDEKGNITFDLERIKPQLTNLINQQAKNHIQNTLQQQDWGETYEECLAEIQNTAIATETKILYFLKPKLPNLTLTQIRENIALYIAKQKTADQITQELTQAGLTNEEVNQYLDLLKSAVEVAQLINWIESVWDYVEQKEKEIESLQTIEELESLTANIKFPEP